MGYVGLCTPIGFANKGIKIVAVDKESKKINLINNRTALFYEPELEDLMKKATKTGNLMRAPNLSAG